MHFLALQGTTNVRFIPNFAAIAVPMTELTRKGQPHRVCWTQRQGDAFQKLKDSLVQGPSYEWQTLRSRISFKWMHLIRGLGLP